MPDLSNATPTFLLDEIGAIRVEANRLKFLEGVYKDALRSRITKEQLDGEQPIVGTRHVGWYQHMEQQRIDTDAVRTHFKDDPETLAQLTKVIEYDQLNIKPKEDQPATNTQNTKTTPKSKTK